VKGVLILNQSIFDIDHRSLLYSDHYINEWIVLLFVLHQAMLMVCSCPQKACLTKYL
jgi:hypothetical protein